MFEYQIRRGGPEIQTDDTKRCSTMWKKKQHVYFTLWNTSIFSSFIKSWDLRYVQCRSTLRKEFQRRQFLSCCEINPVFPPKILQNRRNPDGGETRESIEKILRIPRAAVSMIRIQWNRTTSRSPRDWGKKLRMKCCVNGGAGFSLASIDDAARARVLSFQPYLRRISSFRWMGTTQRTTPGSSIEAPKPSKVDGRTLKQTSRASGMKRKDKRGRRQTILLQV